MEEQKTVLIIGGLGGIGKSLVSRFSKEGWRVYATYRGDAPLTDITEAGVTYIACDITVPNDLTALFEIIRKNGDQLDGVITSVSPAIRLATVADSTVFDYERDMRVMGLGIIDVTLRSLPYMRIHQSTIVHLVSESTESVPPRMSSYITAKYAALGFIKSAFAELARKNIVLCGVSPSFVETSLLNVFPSKLLELDRQKKSDARFIRPEEIAFTLFSIVSKKARCSPGEVVMLRDGAEIAAWYADHKMV